MLLEPYFLGYFLMLLLEVDTVFTFVTLCLSSSWSKLANWYDPGPTLLLLYGLVNSYLLDLERKIGSGLGFLSLDGYCDIASF